MLLSGYVLVTLSAVAPSLEPAHRAIMALMPGLGFLIALVVRADSVSPFSDCVFLPEVGLAD
jgi:hypothetical protein